MEAQKRAGRIVTQLVPYCATFLLRIYTKELKNHTSAWAEPDIASEHLNHQSTILHQIVMQASLNNTNGESCILLWEGRTPIK